MVRILSGGRDPTYLRESAVGDVVQDIGRCRVDVTIRCALHPIGPRADARHRYADVREGVRRYPQTSLPFGVVSPCELRTGLAQQIIHGIAGEALHGFVARGFRTKRRRTVSVRPDQLHRVSRTTAVVCVRSVLRDKDTQRVISRSRRGSGAKNELMRGITWPLVGLKHAVAPSISCCQREVGVEESAFAAVRV